MKGKDTVMLFNYSEWHCLECGANPVRAIDRRWPYCPNGHTGKYVIGNKDPGLMYKLKKWWHNR